ncbi:unnamed protein product [Bemisia tabaci]|uniref:Ionotropic receptor n=1 Tax=Bemisia tabaci TaxID=7038 RepID=A0A9P0A2G6_BEMTA|nr:unnamed protein product [Bemisia tabaci]
MFKFHVLNLMCATLVAVCVLNTSGTQRPTDLKDSTGLTDDRWEPLSSLALSVCENIVKKTDLKLFYKVEINSRDSLPNLIHDLHENSIQTISVSHHSRLTSSVVVDHVKNMIFILDDLNEVLDLIFYTISQTEPLELKRALPHYCIKVDQRYLRPGEQENCTDETRIASSELRDSSVLSDSLFNATRGLHSHKIWNFKNHLIFMIKPWGQDSRKSMPKAPPTSSTDLGSERDIFESLMFCFKFFWRFFKGQRVIICHLDGCKKYDPFAENLVFYQGDGDETFFDFSWKNMHKKSIGVFLNCFANEVTSKFSIFPARGGLQNVQYEVFDRLKQLLNCNVYYHEFWIERLGKTDLFEAAEGLKFGIDIISYGSGILSENLDYSKYDFSVGTDTNALCFATPHSAYMPQALVIFQGFTPILWGFIAVTIVTFCLIQRIFQHLQSEVFRCLYSDVEIDYYRDTSSLLTVYAYFICGNPPSLHLGRLFTGKILFLIFSFSAFIISTLFLSGMTTLLSDRVLYPEIDSLKTFEMSELFIQNIWTTTSEMTTLFDQLNQSEGMKAKLVDNMMFYTLEAPAEILEFNDAYDFGNISYSREMKKVLGDAVEAVEKNVRSIGETNAFLVRLPFSSSHKDNLKMRHFPLNESFDYHLVEECLFRIPSMEIYLKGSFYFEKLNELTAQFLETGHTGRILENSYPDEAWFAEPMVIDGKEPRPFGLNDLQSAFIGLLVGLFLSFFAFLGEILTDHYQHSAIMKCIQRLWMYKNRLMGILVCN